MDDIQSMLQDSANALFNDIVTPDALQRAERGEFQHTIWNALADQGFTLALRGEHADGSGMSWAQIYPLVHAAGRYTLPVPLAETLLANYLLDAAGCAPTDGPTIMTIASVPADAIRIDGGKATLTTALPDIPFGYQAQRIVVNTDIDGVPHIGWLDLTNVTLRTPSSDAAQTTFDPSNDNHSTSSSNISLTAINQGDDNLSPPSSATVQTATDPSNDNPSAPSSTVAHTALNIARESRDTLILHETPLHEWRAVPDLGRAAVMRYGAMLRAAQIAGAIERILEQTLTYATERIQFGRPLAKFQAIQHHIAQLGCEAGAVATAAAYAFEQADRQHPELAIACAKIRAGRAAGQAASLAHAVHGAIGFTYEHSLQYATRRLWSWRSEYGSQSWWALRLGQAVCTPDAQPWWPIATSGELTLNL